MKPTAILINTARGPSCRSGGAGGGAAANDASPAQRAWMSSKSNRCLSTIPCFRFDNVTLLPHIGSASIATRTKMAVRAAQNLVAGLQGQPLPYCVNPEVYAW